MIGSLIRPMMIKTFAAIARGLAVTTTSLAGDLGRVQPPSPPRVGLPHAQNQSLCHQLLDHIRNLSIPRNTVATRRSPIVSSTTRRT
jgi:hypothetical protein